MASNYPASLPVKTAAGANLATNPHSSLHNAMYEDVVAIATELGTTPSSTYDTVKARLEAYESFTSWTSGTVNQTSSISKTVTYSKYQKWGKLVIWNFLYTLSAGGTAGNLITVSLPFTADNVAAVAGAGAISIDGSTAWANGFWHGYTTTSASLWTDGSSSGDGYGSVPSVALASGGLVQGLIVIGTA